MAEPITIRVRLEGGVFVPEEPITAPEGTEGEVHFLFPDQELIARRIAALEAIMGTVKAPPGFDARKISREDMYD